MSNKIVKIILCLTLFLGLAFVSSDLAQASTVKLENKEIFVSTTGLPFNLDNFYPGKETGTKNITIDNDEDFDIDISIGANSSLLDPDFARVLSLEIDGKDISIFDLIQDDLELSSIEANEEKSYDLKIKFDRGAGNQYQEAQIEFDFVITISDADTETEEEVTIVTTPSGGGAPFQPLRISNEQVTLDRDHPTEATITWLTNKEATSRVIYDDQSRPILGELPNYNYTYYTEEYDDKTTFHEVELTDLDPGTTYYYRAVSRISSATIGNEFDFTTYELEEEDQEVKGDKVEGEEEEVKEEEEEDVERKEEEEGPFVEEELIDREEEALDPSDPDPPQDVAGIKIEEEEEEVSPDFTDKEEVVTVEEKEVRDGFVVGALKALNIDPECPPWWLLLLITLFSFLRGSWVRKKDRWQGLVWHTWSGFVLVLTLALYGMGYYCLNLYLFSLLILVSLGIYIVFTFLRSKKPTQQ